MTIIEPDALVERLRHVTAQDRERLSRRITRLARRGGPGQGGALARLEAEIEVAEARRQARAAAVPEVTYPQGLPVSARRDDLLAVLSDHRVVVVAGETGSGKTTQLPKLCLELGRGVDGMIGHTQPRRIAARTVAERLAEELGTPLGGAVGYAVRFDDAVSDTTLVKVMTDGILLAEIRRDPRLTAYDTIIVDEAHERSLNVDFLLGYLARLLERRDDLKVVITSATIDTDRFAAHFGAPVVEVSGRTYPVEVRYRPLRPAEPGAAEVDLNQAIADAVDELLGELPGDILVFLPGERDIRDAAEVLRARDRPGVEILPLYARLSAAEQHRVFRPHRDRRVVLATNVAETSLTVPGVRAVVDTGLARISRYSHRTKVQRLPIEPVSRASADQRAGRCGRVAPGVCVRLYGEDDYLARPPFTDPEILRTNLASVLLQMAAVGLGDVEQFPFVEPPDGRSVADGRALLEELGAFERRGRATVLTPLGRRLAELPLDPRLGRMVVEATARDCLREVTVIAAALSIQDPRERPAEAAAEADELHRRFAVPDSDFLGFVALWDYLAELQGELSGNQFRRRCRAEHLNVLRVREWQDVAGQIRQVLRAHGARPNREPAPAEAVHRSLLAGLLSQVGLRDRIRGDYQGARGARWQIGRGSALARRQPPWVMAGALVETGRTWATTVARIDPAWAEQLGAHLVRRRYAEPWWDAQRAEAMTEEHVSLYGLPIVAGRRCTASRVDPAAARELLLRHGLVDGEWSLDLPPLRKLRADVAAVRALEARARRHGLYVGDEALLERYDERVPAEVTTGRRLERWWRRHDPGGADPLELPFEALVDEGAGPVRPGDYPDTWRQGDLELPLRYRWAPGDDDDGVTVEVPLPLLAVVEATGFDWHVPGARAELVAALVRTLPKDLRRRLVPAAEVAAAVAAECGPEDGPLREVVARRLSSLAGTPVPVTAWPGEVLPAHLRMRFEVIDDDGRPLAAGRDLVELRTLLAPRLRAAVAAVAPEVARTGMTAWELGDLPRVVARGPLRAYPALVDEGESVGVALLDSPEAQAASMWAGTRRLLLLAVPAASRLERRLPSEIALALARARWPLRDLAAAAAAAAADALLAEHGGPAYEAAGFARLAALAADELSRRAASLVGEAAAVVGRAARVAAALAAPRASDRSGALAEPLADARRQLAGLVRPGFVSVAGASRLGDLSRYLEALARRLDRLPSDARRDARRLAVVAPLWSRYDQLALRAPTSPGGSGPSGSADLVQVRWSIEELRVSLWAQDLGTRIPVSEERIRRLLDRLGG